MNLCTWQFNDNKLFENLDEIEKLAVCPKISTVICSRCAVLDHAMLRFIFTGLKHGHLLAQRCGPELKPLFLTFNKLTITKLVYSNSIFTAVSID